MHPPHTHFGKMMIAGTGKKEKEVKSNQNR